MRGLIRPYQAFLVLAVVFGLVGMGFGAYQAYLLFTGVGPAPVSEQLGDLACEEPALQDIEPAGDALDGVEVTNFDRTGEHFRVVDVTEGDQTVITLEFDRQSVFAAHAVRVDGSSPTITVEGTTVTIEDEQADQLKLWVDAETADGERIRHEMELCP